MGSDCGNVPVSMSAVPSVVQKVNHSSENVWLQVGQRFMVISSIKLQFVVVVPEGDKLKRVGHYLKPIQAG